MHRPLRIGLTGGIGSGKSTVGHMLADLGAWLVDTDAISRSLTAPGGAGIAPIRDAFGDDYIDDDGALDRARMRDRVFREPAARRRLEAILHPLIGQETLRQAAQALPGQPVVFDIPLLVESGRWRRLVERVLVVDCSAETQVQRVVRRSGLAPDEVRRIIAQQARREDRARAADAVICNEDLTLEALRAEVQTLWRGWGH
ncbi:MAG TPA: dephospho-CoA kinase [Burkholderiaceae bacterium]|nr:dephospho-CoA kinase [Burkholderiaceae bacterium]